MPRHNRHENRVLRGGAVKRYGREAILGGLVLVGALGLLSWAQRVETDAVTRQKAECAAHGGTAEVHPDAGGSLVVTCAQTITFGVSK